MFLKRVDMGTTPTMENISKDPIASNINLLLSFLRYSLDTVNYEELELASKQNIDWDIFNQLILFHNVGALIQNTVCDISFDLISADTSNLLKKLGTNNAAGNLLLSLKLPIYLRYLKFTKYKSCF